MAEPFFSYISREVNIGNCPLGGKHPIRLQSMTNTDTMDTDATVAQCIRIFEKGAHYVRIATPNISSAQNLENIKKKLVASGFHQPLIADIHFNPEVALVAARLIEKIRINPGNYTDKNTGRLKSYTETEYQAELERIAERISPLLSICKEYGTAIRIGTNHGSLSERIMSRYGDTPEGMVEASMEFLRICMQWGFHNIVVSLKASNPAIMVKATRLLAISMQDENMNFPLHLGVTEAGNDKEARIKSAMGIASLLAYNIGDTIRVSLTEDPEFEIPVAAEIANQFPKQSISGFTSPLNNKIPAFFTSFENFSSKETGGIGGSKPLTVIASPFSIEKPYAFPDYIKPDMLYPFSPDGNKEIIQVCNAEDYPAIEDKTRIIPFFKTGSLTSSTPFPDELNLIEINPESNALNDINTILNGIPTAFILNCTDSLPNMQRFFIELKNKFPFQPVILKKQATGDNMDAVLISSASIPGAMLMDGMGDGIWVSTRSNDIQESNQIAFLILQASRRRITQTEFIACPSCARTSYDIQKVLAEVKQKTSHLKGLKIAVMGCIVNGPGEMADADYGYIGVGGGKVNLYRKKELVIKSVPESQAINELIGIITSDGLWVEP